MVIPDFDENGLLPPGIHACSWREVEHRYGSNRHRRELLAGLKAALLALKRAGCGRVYVDGSFVTDKNVPEDFDGCWDPMGVDPNKLDPVLLNFDNQRAQQKAKYRGEMFVASENAVPRHRKRFLDFFQQTREGEPKGILSLNLTQEFS
ncbi:MAG: hypothetical protein GY937_26380 [bacterium]|nr:hypothetical protein [bacterium]